MKQMLLLCVAARTKLCPKCLIEKPLSAYSRRTVKSLHPCSYCIPCQRSYSRAHYARNKELHNSRRYVRNKASRSSVRQFMVDYLAQHPCVDCGERDLIVLEFDHVRGVKQGDISRMVNNRNSISQIEMEVAKCDVRCANCHRRRTARQRNWQLRIKGSVGR